MKFFKIRENAILPKYQTRYSAGFDFHACLTADEPIKAYNLNNREVSVPVKGNGDEDPYFVANPGIRYLVPTGLIMELEKSTQMLAIHPRSGMALKKGIIMANCTGIIDCDYVDEIFLMVYNISDTSVVIKHGDRIAQGVISNIHHVNIGETTERPQQKTERMGGLGSTGTN